MERRQTLRVVPPPEPTQERTTRPDDWGAVQLIAIAIGLGYVLLGLAALARTGLPIDHLDRPYREVMGFRHSPMLGVAEIGFGAWLLTAGLIAGGARLLMAMLGTVATAFGVVLVLGVAPERVNAWFGVGAPYGWLSVLVGVFVVITAFFLPDETPPERRAGVRRVVT